MIDEIFVESSYTSIESVWPDVCNMPQTNHGFTVAQQGIQYHEEFLMY